MLFDTAIEKNAKTKNAYNKIYAIAVPRARRPTTWITRCPIRRARRRPSCAVSRQTWGSLGSTKMFDEEYARTWLETRRQTTESIPSWGGRYAKVFCWFVIYRFDVARALFKGSWSWTLNYFPTLLSNNLLDKITSEYLFCLNFLVLGGRKFMFVCLFVYFLYNNANHRAVIGFDIF